MVPVGLRPEVECVDEALTEDRRQKLTVRDVLYLGADYAPCLLRMLGLVAGFEGNVKYGI